MYNDAKFVSVPIFFHLIYFKFFICPHAFFSEANISLNVTFRENFNLLFCINKVICIRTIIKDTTMSGKTKCASICWGSEPHKLSKLVPSNAFLIYDEELYFFTLSLYIIALPSLAVLPA